MRSRIVRGEGRRWPGVPVSCYKQDAASFCEVNRRTLLGREAGDELSFEVRYFEVLPGGWTTFEHHEHPHAVIVMAGRGEARLGGERHPIAPFDVVYVAPGEAHQFRAADDERLGILCVVDAERDRPVPLDEG